MKISRWMVVVLAMALMAGWLIPTLVLGTALTEDRDTAQRDGRQTALPNLTGVVYYVGGMIAVSNGLAVKAGEYDGIRVLGRCAKAEDCTGLASEAKDIIIDLGVFRWANAGGVTLADVGNMAYVVDDQTVTNSGSVIAGIILDVDDDGVWVDTMHLPRTAGSFTTISASGAVTFDTTLGVGGAVNVDGALSVDGAAVIGGATTASGNVTVAGAAIITGGTTCSTLKATSTASIDGLITAATGLTATTGRVTAADAHLTDASVASRKVLLTKDDTSQYVIEFGTCTNGQVVAYTTAFGATPDVFLGYLEVPDALTTNKAAVQDNPRTNFAAQGEEAVNMGWFGVGLK